MALLPLALLTPLLAPLRRLAARGWLREADVDGLLRLGKAERLARELGAEYRHISELNEV